MTSTAKKDSASWQAQVAFYLSIGLALFQLYQFLHSEGEARIAASMDIGKKYLSDPEIAKGRQVGMKVVNGTPFSTFAAADADAWNQFILNISYIAELLDKGQLDKAYLTQAIVCDIWLANAAAQHLPKNGHGILQKLGPNLEQDCRSTFPP